MFNLKTKRLSFAMLTLLVLAACNNNSSSIPSLTSIPSSTASSQVSSTTSSSISSITPSSSELPSEEQYQIFLLAQQSGYTGTYQEWLDSIKGADGASLLSGTSNPTSTLGKNGDTYINTSTWDVYVKSGGNWTKVGNVMGPKGADGQDGADGEDGLSAYEIYIANYPDYVGDEEQWLKDLINGNLAEVQTFTVTFDSNGGTPVPSQQVKRLDKVTKPADPTKNGNTFDGWYIGNEKWVFSGYNVTENITLTARWNQSIEEIHSEEGLLFATYIRNKRAEYSVIGYLGNKTSISIPSKVNGYDVTAISPYAFHDNYSSNMNSGAVLSNPLRGVILPESIVSIGAYAFANSKIESIVIPDNLTSIGVGAFYNNPLHSLSLGSGLREIQDFAFRKTALTSIVIPNSVTTIGKGVFSENQLTSVTISNSVTTIDEWAFSGNQLTSVTIPNSVTTVGSYAFFNNPLTSITIPNSVTTIGAYAFSSSQPLTIYAEATVKPQGWDENWFSTWQPVTVIWDYKNQ
jgi:uncharacterized repeat protein (TIGR02543 family)